MQLEKKMTEEEKQKLIDELYEMVTLRAPAHAELLEYINETFEKFRRREPSHIVEADPDKKTFADTLIGMHKEAKTPRGVNNFLFNLMYLFLERDAHSDKLAYYY